MAIPSVSPDVNAENCCAEEIGALLRRDSLDPVFWEVGDGRRSVACLLKSRHPQNNGRTVVLASHFDTVGIEDFARLGDASPAFHPGVLARALKEMLEREGRIEALSRSERAAWRALESGEWMFGRGSVDMKSGVAIQIAVMREFARTQENGRRLIDGLRGNLLFLSCPDEETESAGILSALPEALKLRDREGLSYLGAINADYVAPRDADEDTRFIYSGVIGKLLPAFYILGKRTHVGEVFRGVDAAHIAAELVSRINLNPDWSDVWRGTLGGEEVVEVAPPPIALQMRDRKLFYNVETAGEAFVYVNWLTLTLTPEQAMGKMKAVSRASLDAVRDRQTSSFEKFLSQGGQAQPPSDWNSIVLDYAALLDKARMRWEAKNNGEDFSAWIKATAQKHNALAKDGRELSCMLVAELAKLAQIGGPAVVVFFAPPYYPPVQPQEDDLAKAVRSALWKTDEKIRFRGFYPYISDLSYAHWDESIEIAAFKENLPLFELRDSQDALLYALDKAKIDEIRALHCPVVNIGPFGSDAHGLYERVYMPYSFERVPQMIFDVITMLLREETL